jgi:uncharacterized SAM-binding protein YcdF (DUF218 family)
MILLVCGVVAALTHRRRLAIVLTAAGLFWVTIWSLPVTTLYFGGKLEAMYAYSPSESQEKGDVIMVLGGNTQANRANWFEPYNRSTATDRIDRAQALYLNGRAPKILLSGGALEGKVSEAQGMAQVLKHRGLPESALLLENESRNTYENVLLSQPLLKQLGNPKVLVVTSALHMPRAMAVFKSQGINAIPAPVAPQIVPPDDYTLYPWLPHTRSLEASRSIIKEYFGLIGYWIRDWI